jgi:hypothetical protein
MENLPEELVEQIILESTKPLPSRHGSSYGDLLSLSLVSHKFNRITEPLLYRSVNLSNANRARLLQLMRARGGLASHIHTMFFIHDPLHTTQLTFISHLPNLRSLDIDISPCELIDLVAVLKFPSLTTLCLSGVEATPAGVGNADKWAFFNDTITKLDMSFAFCDECWEYCDEVDNFAAIFRSLRSLKLHSTKERFHPRELGGPVFRCLVKSFKRAFETTLRAFDFRYNDPNFDRDYDGNEAISNTYDARSILKQSQLEHLKLETDCLLRPGNTLRSTDISVSCLPLSLRSLYIRHQVEDYRLSERERNMMYSDEAECLSQLVKLSARKSRFPHLQKITLAVFLPQFFEEVACRVVKIQARAAKAQLEPIFV